MVDSEDDKRAIQNSKERMISCLSYLDDILSDNDLYDCEDDKRAILFAIKAIRDRDRLTTENVELQEKITSLEAELEHMTMQFYAALNHDECRQ